MFIFVNFIIFTVVCFLLFRFNSKQSFWVPGPSPTIIAKPTLKILSKQAISATNVLFHLEIAGPDHMSFFFQPSDDAKLVDWSFNKEVVLQNLKPPYFVYFSYALDPTPLKFTIEFEVGIVIETFLK